ncbi:MAG TPA: fumarylacetoacetate hydrolase family protein [Candidatus Angelobacter sp.]|nr:fumarylacetoacetate hydrolase family protein [Candidatus Angelobacter sp.]
MKYCRISTSVGPMFGLIENVKGQEQITQTAPDGPLPVWIVGNQSRLTPLSEAKLLAPVSPSKIVCVGRNYRDHAKELGNEVPVEPLTFFKPPSSLIAPEEDIVLPASLSERVEYEGELGVVIGKKCRKIGANEDVRPYIFGYTCANDVTARDLQKKDNQWTRAKGFDSFCPVGPFVTDQIDPWVGVQVETRLNGEIRQNASTSLFIFPLDVVLRYISRVMTLLPGDLVLTGTPGGVGPMAHGDRVTVTVEGVGSLSNPVVKET